MTPLIVPNISDADPAWSVIVIIGWLTWQLYAPLLLGIDTRLSPLVDLPDRVEDVERELGNVSNRVDEVNEKQPHHLQVTRAQARALDDDKSVTISSEEVDNYLVDNGVPVGVFTRDADTEDDDEINEYMHTQNE